MAIQDSEMGQIDEVEDVDVSMTLSDVVVQLGAIERVLERSWEDLMGIRSAEAGNVIRASKFIHRAVLALDPEAIA